MRNVQLPEILPFKVPPIVDTTDQLPYVKRWEELKKPYRYNGLWDGKTYHTGFRKPEEVDTIVIHHSGSPEGTIESHARYHANKWGAGIAYHMVIDKGTIFQTNNLLSFTYHVGNHNTYTVGICVNRDLRKKDLTDQERDLLYAAILSVKKVLPIVQIKGHNELNATECPATNMNRIRQDIVSLEEQIAYMQSDSSAAAQIVRLAFRVDDLAGKLDGKWADEAKRKLGLLEAILVRRGFGQERLTAAERIKALYETWRGGGQWSEEAMRKLLIIADDAQNENLL